MFSVDLFVFSPTVILWEHAGTLLFASDPACQNFAADTGVDFHGSVFAALFLPTFM